MLLLNDRQHRLKSLQAISCKVGVKVINRSMFTRNIINKVAQAGIRNPHVARLGTQVTETSMNKPNAVSAQERGFAYYFCYKPQTAAAKKFSTDGTGTHTMHAKAVCDETDCKKKVCSQPCSEVQTASPKGNFTHKPPKNATSEYLSATDIQGKNKPQHYVKAKNATNMSADDLKNMTEDDMKIDHKANHFTTTSSSILSKIIDDQ